MFQAGDYVMYGGNGLCLIESIGVPSFQPSKGSPDYYFLRKADDNSRIYVPVDTPLPIRCPMAQEEAESAVCPSITESRDPSQARSENHRKVV